jgi:hypothetical protein
MFDLVPVVLDGGPEGGCGGEIRRLRRGRSVRCRAALDASAEDELRATVIGRRIFTVKINSQETLRGRIDWREAQRRPRGQSSDLTFEPMVLPAAAGPPGLVVPDGREAALGGFEPAEAAADPRLEPRGA